MTVFYFRRVQATGCPPHGGSRHLEGRWVLSGSKAGNGQLKSDKFGKTETQESKADQD